uniref:Uncharacterized protein n=1 Tax=Triticum urartu TaxID=4572 RepID=A0A8R7K3Q7_TRIUA
MSAASGAACRVCGGGAEDCSCLLQRGRGAAGVRCGVADLNRGFPGMFGQAAEEPAVDVVGAGGGAAAVGLQEFQFFGQEDHESVAWLFNDHAPLGGEDRLQHRPAPTEQLQRRQAFDAYADYQPGHGLTFDVPVPLSRDVVDTAILGLGGGNPVTSAAAIVSDALLRERNVDVHGSRGQLGRPERRHGGGAGQRRRVLCRPKRRRRRRRTGTNGAAGGEADAVQREAEEAAVREADPVRVPQGLRRDAAARQGTVRQGARRRRGRGTVAVAAAAADAGRRLRARPARPRVVPLVASRHVLHAHVVQQ